MPKTLKIRPRSQRVRDDDSTDEPYSDEMEASSPSIMIDGEDVGDFDSASENDDGIERNDGFSGDEEASAGDSGSVSGSEEADEDVQAQLSKVSFADLAKAQARMSKTTDGDRKRKRGADTSAETTAKLDALRERLRELRDAKGNSARSAPVTKFRKAQEDSDDARSNTGSASGTDSDEDSDRPEEGPTKRSKHAPMAAPSNKAVTRKRTVVASDKPSSSRARDPRFAPLSGSALSADKTAKNYAFLDDYRQSEIAELKERLGDTKKGRNKPATHAKKGAAKLSEEEKARLRKELVRMESQEQSRKEKQRLEEVAKKHKGEETDKIAQGKNPFFLKKSEQKRLALVNKFEGMKSKQRDKALDRRRKKIAGKEKKSMPAARRITT